MSNNKINSTKFYELNVNLNEIIGIPNQILTENKINNCAIKGKLFL